MTNEEKRFREYLAYYGADVETWPAHARILGRRLQHKPDYAQLVHEERRFEELLLEAPSRDPRGDLATRIVAKAIAGGARRFAWGPQHWYSEVIGALNPAALAATLLLGVALGFGQFGSTPINTDNTLSLALDEEGSNP